VGANLRRIEAVTSFDAYELVREEEAELHAAADAMRVTPRDVSEKAALLVRKLKEAESMTKRAADAMAGGQVGELISGAVDLGYKVVVARVEPVAASAMRGSWDILRSRGADAVVLATTDSESGKAIMMAAGTEAAVAAGFDAGAVVREMASVLGGRGGGKPAMAQGGGENVERIDEALVRARELLGAS
jgi:alanyl-tRNA synthetase